MPIFLKNEENPWKDLKQFLVSISFEEARCVWLEFISAELFSEREK